MKQYRNFNIIAYNIWHVKGIVELVNNLKGYYCYIKHKAESDEKKEHYHLVIVLNKGQRITLNKIVKNANIYNDYITDDNIEFTENLIQVCSSIPLSIQYLLHMNDIDKIQYQANDLITNDINFTNYNLSVNFSYSNETDLKNQLLNELFDLISGGFINSMFGCIEFLRKNNHLDLYSKNKYLIRDLIIIYRGKENEK